MQRSDEANKDDAKAKLLTKKTLRRKRHTMHVRAGVKAKQKKRREDKHARHLGTDAEKEHAL